MKISTLFCAATLLFMLTGCNDTHALANVSAPIKIADPVKHHVTVKKPRIPTQPILVQGMTSKDALKLNEDLAQLDYLPLNYTDGNFTWKYTNTPSTLKSFWSPNTFTVMTKGAVMHLQEENGLAVDGEVGSQTWKVINSDLAKHAVNTGGYSYVYVAEDARPQTLTLWKNGSYIMSTRCNTGVIGAETPKGTWPVYLRYLSQTMKGHNVDGSTYDDPGVPWVSYFYEGCAVHGFPRSSYGYQQSLGCVELPISTAKTVFYSIDYGTLVTIGR